MNFKHWTTHFAENKSHFDNIQWTSGELSQKEKEDITASIQQFQKGESSEGIQLKNAAWKHSLKLNDIDYARSIHLFIEEEQSHSRALGRFMELNNIPKIEEHWIDNLFRKLRKGSNIERTVMVLVTAEIIATPYYRALHDATQSKTLKSICKQILIDEKEHVDFQAEAMTSIYQGRNTIHSAISKFAHRALLFVSACFVYKLHKPVFKAARVSFSQFINSCYEEFDRFQTRVTELSQAEKRTAKRGVKMKVKPVKKIATTPIQ